MVAQVQHDGLLAIVVVFDEAPPSSPLLGL